MDRRMMFVLLASLTYGLWLTSCAVLTESVEPLPSATPRGADIDQTLVIRTGTYFGACRGYCVTEILITSVPVPSSPDIAATAIVTRASNLVNDLEYPTLVEEIPLVSAVWDELLRETLTHADIFFELPDTLGCPDCADGGGEWIELSMADRTRRVDFGFGVSVSEIEGLVVPLRRLRESLVDSIDP